MAEIAQSFDDSAAYERFMGRWSRAVGPMFLAWVAPPSGARWLEIGCGTGVFTEVTLAYPEFDVFWHAQTPSYNPTTKTIAALTRGEQTKLMETVRAGLPVRLDGQIEYSARANMITARAPH